MNAAVATRSSSTSRTGRAESGFGRRSGGYLRGRDAQSCAHRVRCWHDRARPQLHSLQSVDAFQAFASRLPGHAAHRAGAALSLFRGGPPDDRPSRRAYEGDRKRLLRDHDSGRRPLQHTARRRSRLGGELRDRKAATRADVLAGAFLGVARPRCSAATGTDDQADPRSFREPQPRPPGLTKHTSPWRPRPNTRDPADAAVCASKQRA